MVSPNDTRKVAEAESVYRTGGGGVAPLFVTPEDDYIFASLCRSFGFHPQWGGVIGFMLAADGVTMYRRREDDSVRKLPWIEPPAGGATPPPRVEINPDAIRDPWEGK